MPASSWNDIPSDFQARVAAGDPSVLGPLAAWMHSHPPCRVNEDLVQHVLITLCRLMSSERGQSLLKATRSVPNLLASIASRHRVDEFRAERRLRHAVERLGSRRKARDAHPDVVAILSRAEIRDSIREAFARLSPLERDALERALVLGEPYRVIASTLLGPARSSADEQRLRQIVHRTRVKLMARLALLRSG